MSSPRRRAERRAQPRGAAAPRRAPQERPARTARPPRSAPIEAPQPAPPLERPRKRREALSHVGGPSTLEGDPALARALALALDVSSAREQVLDHVHGFHSYPARLHPVTARRAIERLSEPGATVLDPFCGSGTILVEARELRRRAIGIDANPLAIELCWLKTGGLGPERYAALLEAAGRVAEHATLRRKARAGPTHRYGPGDRELFDSHVLLELDGLRDGIRTLAVDEDLRRTLSLVVSSMLTKVSRQPGDTSEERVPRRVAGGYAIRFFEQRTALLVEQLKERDRRLPPRPPPCEAWVGDARQLEGVGTGSVDLILSSPPYAGIYDYHEQHATRLRWLGLDGQRFEQRELGSRRRLDPLPFARALGLFEQDLSACLREARRVLEPSGRAAIVIADSVLAGRPLWAGELIARLASQAGLVLVARASQPRPHFHGPTSAAFRDRARQEHLVLLAKR